MHSVELLYFDDCPSYEAFLPHLEVLLKESGGGERVERTRVATVAEAIGERFLGSPTLRIDGRDVEPGAEERTDFGLKCRLYLIDGGYSPVPPDDWVLGALGRARRR